MPAVCAVHQTGELSVRSARTPLASLPTFCRRKDYCRICRVVCLSYIAVVPGRNRVDGGRRPADRVRSPFVADERNHSEHTGRAERVRFGSAQPGIDGIAALLSELDFSA